MSLKAAKDFLKKLKRSKALQKKVQAAIAKSVVDLARDNGFEFTRAELTKARKAEEKEDDVKTQGSDDYMLL
ncbi:MAG TPA: Nif11-like leader peptide family natural product precursor [Thermoanaerobaculia bacterium]|nr:Nif11-like leader peptide family natural product precursor [Thermoanaerobaculia bacterium]